MVEEKEKDSYFRFRIDSKTKEEFQQIADKKAVNISALFRQWIVQYISENK